MMAVLVALTAVIAACAELPAKAKDRAPRRRRRNTVKRRKPKKPRGSPSSSRSRTTARSPKGEKLTGRSSSRTRATPTCRSSPPSRAAAARSPTSTRSSSLARPESHRARRHSAFAGPIAKTVTLETNDPVTPTAQLTIHAIVKPYVEAFPAGFVRFNMLQGDAERRPSTLYSEEDGRSRSRRSRPRATT